MPDPVNCPHPVPNPLVRTAVRQALNGAMLSGAVAATFGVGTAHAQQGPEATASTEPELQEVVVTGSRIKRTSDFTTATPTTVFDATELENRGIDPRASRMLSERSTI